MVLNAHPVDVEKAKNVGLKFACTKFEQKAEPSDFQLVYTGLSDRNEACFYVFNSGEQGFVIVSADDRFRPIVGYSDEGPFATENRSPELDFYLEKIIDARTRLDAVFFDDTEAEWQSVMTTGKLLSRNRGRGVDYICQTKWNQDSPYNLYAPEASSGPGGRCYAGCVATAMSQVMKYWDHPLQGTGSNSYYCYGYGQLSANFGATTYDWDNMPIRLGGNSSQEEIEAVALLMYHCAVAVEMGFSPSGSGANSWDVPQAIKQHFSYSNQAKLKNREDYSLFDWQDMLKEQFDLGWPVYYSGFSESAGHAFVCDGYDDDDLFHFNWGWGGSSDGWFVIDEIDYAGWEQAVFNYVPTNVYNYMPMQPENYDVVSLGDNDFSATLSWTNPTHTVRGTLLEGIDQVVVTRDGVVIHTEDNPAPGADMSFTDHYMPTSVRYAVYAVLHDAKGLEAVEENVLLGPTCVWRLETETIEGENWDGAYLSFVNSAGVEIGQFTNSGAMETRNVLMPVGHVEMHWNMVSQNIEKMRFELKDAEGQSVVSFEGSSSELPQGLFFIVNNTCGNELNLYVPENLVAMRDNDEVLLQWDAVNGTVNGYCVYRDGVLYAISETVSYIDTEAFDTFHIYFVTTLTDTGESDASNVCNIQAGNDCEAPSGLKYEMNNTKVKLTWDAPQGSAATGYYVYRRVRGDEFKRIKAVGNTTYSDNINSQPDGVYEYAVTAYYQANDCTSAYASTQAQPELNTILVNKTIIPRGLEAEVTGNNVVLTWESALKAEAYNVYRNGVMVAHDLTETFFTDENISMRELYCYQVTGKTATLESNFSNAVMVDFGATVLENANGIEISLYPNPTIDKLSVVSEGIDHVVVINLMGQEVLCQSANANETVLDLSVLPQGTYFIKVVTEKGSAIKKVMKIK